MSEKPTAGRDLLRGHVSRRGDTESPSSRLDGLVAQAEGTATQGETDTVREIPGKRWVALHCKPRAEKLVAQYCRISGIVHCLPLRRKVHRYTRKVAVFEVPLFPGYVFCAIDAKERLSLLRTNRIVSILSVRDEISFLNELRQVVRATQITNLVERTDFDATGRMVVVLTGPLAGLRGRVVEKRGKTGLRLNLGLLNQAALVHIDLTKDQVEVVQEVDS